MLVHLSITNFAIIEHLEITLLPGLNIMSGETGAGKSIIINAMNLLLGGRASADVIRTGCKEARVEALFAFPHNRLLKDTLEAMDLPFQGELLIKRTIYREGRNRIFINGSIATLQNLTRLGAFLISISGQHEHQLLLNPENHILLLDDFGGLSPERAALKETFDNYQSLKKGIERLEKEIKDITDREDLTRFQIQEIERAALDPGEEALLGAEKKRLQHAEELLEIITEGYQNLYEREDSVLSAVSRCVKGMEKGSSIDPRLSSIRDVLGEIQARLEDTAFTLRDFQNTVHMEPNRLEEVAERLELINSLKRKYGPTLDDVLRFKESLKTLMEDINEKTEKLKNLRNQQIKLESTLTEMATSLSQRRKKAAGAIEVSVEKELQQLHMEGTKFRIAFDNNINDQDRRRSLTASDIGPYGIDTVEFMICPNVGEELRPLSKIASGGELSRIMLAVKTILARTGSVETIIFDEVDSGISGRTAEVVGEKLETLAQYHQILCITHLPQIASKGKAHFLVKKDIVGERTQTAISELEPEGRVREIARLLGGREITKKALAHAKEMLG